MNARNVLGVSALLFLVAAIVVVFTFRDQVDVLRQWVTGMGARGVAIFIGVYVLWMLTTIPAIPLMAAAGLMYGPLLGALYCLIGISIGATATFFLGRFFGREHFDDLGDRYDTVRRVMREVEHHQALSVALVRIAPVFPLNLLNYGLGALRVRFPTYLVVTLLMGLPGAAMYAGLGGGLGEWVFGEGGLPAWFVPLIVGAGLTMAAVGYVVRRRFWGDERGA